MPRIALKDAPSLCSIGAHHPEDGAQPLCASRALHCTTTVCIKDPGCQLICLRPEGQSLSRSG